MCLRPRHACREQTDERLDTYRSMQYNRTPREAPVDNPKQPARDSRGNGNDSKQAAEIEIVVCSASILQAYICISRGTACRLFNGRGNFRRFPPRTGCPLSLLLRFLLLPTTLDMPSSTTAMDMWRSRHAEDSDASHARTTRTQEKQTGGGG